LKRGDFRLAADEEAKVSGPPMIPLACGCIVDDIGGIWSPCAAIAEMHARACELAKQGLVLPADMRRGRGWVRWEEPEPSLENLLDDLRNHVANAKREATLAEKRQAALVVPEVEV